MQLQMHCSIVKFGVSTQLLLAAALWTAKCSLASSGLLLVERLVPEA